MNGAHFILKTEHTMLIINIIYQLHGNPTTFTNSLRTDERKDRKIEFISSFQIFLKVLAVYRAVNNTFFFNYFSRLGRNHLEVIPEKNPHILCNDEFPKVE